MLSDSPQDLESRTLHWYLHISFQDSIKHEGSSKSLGGYLMHPRNFSACNTIGNLCSVFCSIFAKLHVSFSTHGHCHFFCKNSIS